MAEAQVGTGSDSMGANVILHVHGRQHMRAKEHHSERMRNWEPPPLGDRKKYVTDRKQRLSATESGVVRTFHRGPLDGATILIGALEDAADFNAGYGSNVTFNGHIEWDASLISSMSSLSFLYGMDVSALYMVCANLYYSRTPVRARVKNVVRERAWAWT
jgi:Asparaginase